MKKIKWKAYRFTGSGMASIPIEPKYFVNPSWFYRSYKSFVSGWRWEKLG